MPTSSPRAEAPDGQPAATGLRLALAALLACTLAASHFLLALPVIWPVGASAVAAVVLLAFVDRARGRRGVVLGTFLDMTCIAVVLAASGGAANPFTALFFVHVAVAASALPGRQAFAVAAFGAAAFGALFAAPAPAECHVDTSAAAFNRHLWGMWGAWAVAAGLVTVALTRARALLAERDRELARLRDDSEAAARFAAIGTLAAGAAHELGTPLGTIAVLAGELRARGGRAVDQPALESIAQQVERCRGVLARLQTGALGGEPSRRGAPLGSTVREAVTAFEGAHPGARVEVRLERDAVVELSPADLTAAVDVLLDNAWSASMDVGATDPIHVDVGMHERFGAVVVRDRGVGLGAVPGERLGEPFLTTKDVGKGMGLGLYIVRRAVEATGGKLVVRARPGGGAEAELWVPSCAPPSPA